MINIFKQFENGHAFHWCLLYSMMLHQNERKWNVKKARMLITYI